MLPVQHHELLEMPGADSRLVLELFNGSQSSARDKTPSLSPLARRIVTFAKILPKGSKISLTVELTSDRQLCLELVADHGGPVKGIVTVGTAPGWDPSGTGAALPDVNQSGGIG